jgi:GNAT superfamily N-acetyltransferase
MRQTMLVANAALARKLDRTARQYLVTRYSGPGNPMGAEILDDGGMVATKVPFVPQNSLMNRATGIEHPRHLDDLIAFYGATRQAFFWVEVTPYTPIEVTDALLERGFKAESSASSLYASPLPAPADRALQVCVVNGQTLDAFLDTLNTGFGTPPNLLDGLRANQRFWVNVPTWHLFLARVDGEPAGAAVLSLHDEIAYLAAASTLPPFRNRGLQTALIATRIATARALGATIVTGQAEWGSSSQANMQRAGLQISHVRVLWTNSRSGEATIAGSA